MSRAGATATFPDGTIKYGIYNGTVDVFKRHLFDTSEEAWNYWDELKKAGYDDSKWIAKEPEQAQIFDIKLHTSYGSGRTYKAKATKYAITSSCDIDDLEEIKA